MNLIKRVEKYLNRSKNRRDFMSEQFRLFAAGFLFSWPLSSLIRVRPASAADQPQESKKVGGLKSTKHEPSTPAPIHPLAKKFIGEKLVYNVTFLWVVDAAIGTISFKQTTGENYEATFEAKATGVVSWLTTHRRQVLTSTMQVKKVNGVERFLTTVHNYDTYKEKEEYHTTNILSYQKRTWYSRKVKDGKVVRSRTRKMKGDQPYDDFVVASYNFRAGVYGDVTPGKKFTITTIPWKGITKFSFHVLTKEEMKKHGKLLGKFPDAEYMVRVDIDQKIFGIKTGSAYLVGTKDLVPLAAQVEDVVHFGNVYAELKRPGQGK